MPMHSSIEYSDNYSKSCEGLCQYRRNESDGDKTNSESFKFEAKIRAGKTTKDSNTKNVEIVATLKYLSNFLRILEMPLIN